LNSGRSLYAVSVALVALCLLAAGLAIWESGRAAGGRPLAGRPDGVAAVVAVCCVVVAVGVIWLGWYGRKLARGITSIAASLPWQGGGHPCPPSNVAPNAFIEAVKAEFRRCAERIAELERRLEDSQIEMRLATSRQKNAEAIINSMRDAVIVADEFDRLLLANEAAGRLFGFDFRSSQRKPLEGLIGGDNGEFVDFLTRSKKSKVRASRREIRFSSGAAEKTYDCIVTCVLDEKGQICGSAAVLHDITREKEISQMKNDFVSHVSHELKTPLASITAYTEMLADGEADDEQTRKEFYSVIQTQAKRLNRLIEDMLNISRIESGLIKVNKEAASLTMLIEEQLQMIKGCAEEKNVRVIGQKPIVFDQVYIDRDMISQVIVNLLSNAVKYTPSGGSVTVKTEVDEIGQVARVSVTDTGVGIPEDEIDHVFEKFYRVNANKKQAKGTGLGLNLVKEIVEKVHGGRVFVRSKVGQGSTFGFELPLARTEQTASV